MSKKPPVRDPGSDLEDAVQRQIFASHATAASAAVIMDRSTEPGTTLGMLKNEPVLSLLEEDGQLRAGVGNGGTITPDGKTVTSPESSRLRLGPDGKKIWSVP
jgi:hypothetical protein